MTTYTYRIELANLDNVQCEVHDPKDELLREPSGVFRFSGK